MRNYILAILFIAIIGSCNTYKKAQKDIYSGNFDEALDNMLKKYAKGNIKDKDIVRWTETFNTAYAKANAQNIDDIYKSQYMVESSEKYRIVLANYSSLQSRYDKLKPYLPIKVNGEVIPIRHENYGMQLENAKLKLVDALYSEAEDLMKSKDKFQIRAAYDKYIEISQLIPNYTLIQEKLATAYNQGQTHILVLVNNDSRTMLPKNLHEDIAYIQADNTRFFWQKIHTQPSKMIYDYTIELNFRDINVSPELVDRTQNFYTKKWIDSSQIAKDARGNILKDSLGRPIKIYTNQSAQCKVSEIRQSKSAYILSEFIVLDARGQLLSRISPVESNFNFRNMSYIISGDEQALEKEIARKIKHSSFLPFPSDEKMIFDCGQDLKQRFASYIAENLQGK